MIGTKDVLIYLFLIVATAGVTVLVLVKIPNTSPTCPILGFTLNADLVREIREEIDNPQFTAKATTWEDLWTTPIIVGNFANFGVSVPDLNSKLAASISEVYNQTLKANGHYGLNNKPEHEHDANRFFFDWQMNGGWNIFMKEESFQQWEKSIRQIIRFYLRRVKASDGPFRPWATVHSSCMAHMAHVHPEAIISGVYYVKTPSDSGLLRLHDPRGPLPPFGGVKDLHPSPGDFIIFPGWLRHEVLPTPGANQRISIAFNIDGEWDQTTGRHISEEISTTDIELIKRN